MCFIFNFWNLSYSQTSYFVIMFGFDVVYVHLSYQVLLAFSDTYILLTPHIFPWQGDEITLLSYWCYLSVYRSASKSSLKSLNTVNWIEGIYIYICVCVCVCVCMCVCVCVYVQIFSTSNISGLSTLLMEWDPLNPGSPMLYGYKLTSLFYD